MQESDGSATTFSDAVATSKSDADALTAEIETRLEFVPSLFDPACAAPPVLESLWRQMVACYIDNPLPTLFKEQLFALLARFCPEPYCLVCHSCALRPLGMTGREIFTFLQSTTPTDIEFGQPLSITASIAGPLTAWPAPGSPLEEAFLTYAIIMFLKLEQAGPCRTELRRLLGPTLYSHLAAFLAFVRTCFDWVEMHPELSYEADKRAQDHLDPLLADEPHLAAFFQDYALPGGRGRQDPNKPVANEGNALETTTIALRASQTLLRAVVDAVPDHLYVKDLEGRYVLVNAAMARLFGRSSEEMLGMAEADLAPPAEADWIAEIDRGVLATGQRVSLEETLTGRDGARRLLTTKDVYRNERDEIVGLISVSRDITERSAAEEQNDRLFESPLCLIFIAGLDGFFKRVSVGYETLLGWTEEEMLSRPYMEFLHPDDIGSLAAAIEDSVGGLDVVDQEIRVLGKDGSHRWLVGSFRPVLEEGLMYGVAVDVTERKQLEEAIARRSAELEASNRELEAFTYSVSHDLRAPLRAMDGLSRILLEDYGSLLPAEGQQYLHGVRDGAQKMGILIDDLLAFSRLARQSLTKRRVMPTDLVRQVLAELVAEQEGRRVEIAIGELPPCQADPALLKQVYANLLANALKFTRHREVAVIEIGWHADETLSGGGFYFVRDNGTGFDMAYAHKLFAVFQRLHGVTEYEGTGVGLAIVHRIIDRHGGRVWADAEPDRGATFAFYLPAGDSAHAIDPAPAAPSDSR